MNKEGISLEYKREFTLDIKKEVVAFANSQGGELFVGIDDNGAVVGLANADAVMEQVSNSIMNGIKPDVTIFCDIKVVEMEGKQVVRVDVARGTKRPYYLSDKGMKPTGVYVRLANVSAPASDESIRKMILESDAQSYEKRRSFNQSLTFEYAKEVFSKNYVEFSSDYFTALKLVDEDGQYTNLAFLLSDQCTFSIKVAAFSGEGEVVDRRVIEGSLFKQAQECFTYISLSNKLASRVEGLSRVEHWDYAPNVLREAMLNAIVHRDYGFSASIAINIYPTFIEFVSVGGIFGSLTVDEIKIRGVSLCRNQGLADIFYRLKLIEAYGWGLSNIFDYFKKSQNQPLIIATENTFRLTIPSARQSDSSLSQQESAILRYVDENGGITSAIAQSLLGVKQARASVLLNTMVQKKLLSITKQGKANQYKRL